MKKLLIIILAVAAILLFTPKIVGLQVEDIYQQRVDESASNPAYQIEINSIESGWFGSLVEWKLSIPELGDKSVLVVRENLTHGPLMLTDDGLQLGIAYSTYQLDLQGMGLSAEDNQMVNDKLHIRNVLGFTRSMKTLIDSDAFEITKDGETLTVKPVAAEFNLDAALKELDGQLNWPGMKLQSGGDWVNVGAATLSYDLGVVSGNLLDGSALTEGDLLFSVDEISAQDELTGMQFSAKDIRFTASTDIDGQLADNKVEYVIGELNAMAETVKNAKLSLEMNNLDATVLAELNQMGSMLRAGGNGIASADPQKLTALVPRFIAANPELNITELNADVNEGQFSGQLAVHINQDKFDPANMMSALMALEAKGQISGPEGWFVRQGMGPAIEQFVAQGMLEKQEGILKSVLNIENGQFTVNGNPVPLM